MTEGTITPEVRIKELEEALATETDRLQKLFAAYETQEKELVDSKAKLKFSRRKSSTEKSRKNPLNPSSPKRTFVSVS